MHCACLLKCAPGWRLQLLRELVPPVFRFQQKHRMQLNLLSNCSLAFIIWQTLSGGRDIIVNTKFGNMLIVILATAVIHVVYLVFNTLAVLCVICLCSLLLPYWCSNGFASSLSIPHIAVPCYRRCDNPCFYCRDVLYLICMVGTCWGDLHQSVDLLPPCTSWESLLLHLLLQAAAHPASRGNRSCDRCEPEKRASSRNGHHLHHQRHRYAGTQRPSQPPDCLNKHKVLRSLA